MEYTLIKQGDNFVLVNDENTDIPPYAKHETYFGKKVIASLEKCDNLPTIIFTEEVAKELGIVDLTKQFEYLYKKQGLEWLDRKEHFRMFFIETYKQANDNKDKIYSHSDVECLLIAMAFEVNQNGYGGHSITHPFVKWWIKQHPELFAKDKWQVTISHDETNNAILITKII